MIELTIKKKRKCYATFDSYTGGVNMELEQRGVKVLVEFDEKQWEQFVRDVDRIQFISAHHGQC